MCRRAVDTGKPFDLVIANAGVWRTPRARRRTGSRPSSAPTTRAFRARQSDCDADDARFASREFVVGGPSGADVDLKDPNFERMSYDRSSLRALEDRKVLFAVEFDRRHKASGLSATAVHPGVIETEHGRHMGRMRAQQDRANAGKLEDGGPPFSWKTIPQGAATSSGAASSHPPIRWAVAIAKIAMSRRLRATRANLDGVRPYALNPERARALWTKSEEMVGERLLSHADARTLRSLLSAKAGR